MKNLLKTELYKFSHSYSLWIILAIIFLGNAISILTGTFDSVKDMLININKDSMVPILACSIYCAIIVSNDFSNGLVEHYISCGYTRVSIILSKFFHYILGCTVLIITYSVLNVILAVLTIKMDISFMSFFEDMVQFFVRVIPLYWGIFSISFLILILIKKGVIGLGVSLTFSIFLVVFTNKFYFNIPDVLQYSPVIQISELATGTLNDTYVISLFLSFLMIIISLLLSSIKFYYDEL